MKVDPDPMLEEDHAPEHLSPGTELLGGIYTIRQFLARGGFGITYLAQDSLDRAVVIKECFPVDLCDRDIETGCVEPTVSPDDFDRLVRSFYREAKSLSRLKHQNVIQVHNVFGENGTAFIAMDYVDGCDLFDVIESASPLRTPRTVISMLRQLLDALAYIHDQGMLHRDISPDNVLVNDDGVPVLIDFGAADTQDAHTQRIRTRLHAVKDGYSPQELYIQGLKQTPAADIYGLGATFYHLISGEAPPPSQSRLQAAGMGDADPYQPLAGQVATYPDGLLRTIDRALAIRPADRFQNAEDWLKELDDELGNENIVTLRQVRSIVEAEAQDETSAPTDPEPTAPLPRPSSAAQSRAKPRKRGWGIAGATAAFAATVAAVAVFVEIPQVSGPAVFLPQQQTEAVAAAPRSVGSIPVLAAPEAQTATQLALPRDSQHTATARAPVMPASGNPVIVASMPAIEAIDPLGATRSILVEAPAKAETASIPATAERDDVPLVFARTTETAPARPAQSGSRSRQDAPVALNAEANRVVASLTSEGPPVFSANTVNAAADNIRTAARHPFATVADAVVPALEQRTNDLAMRPEPVSLANADALAQTLRGAPLDPAQRLTETFAAPPEAGTTAPQVPTTSSTPLTRPPLPEVTSLERLARASGITEGQIAQSPNLGLARIGADQPVFLSGVGSLGRPDAGASYVDRIGPKRIPVRMRNVSVPVAPLLAFAELDLAIPETGTPLPNLASFTPRINDSAAPILLARGFSIVAPPKSSQTPVTDPKTYAVETTMDLGLETIVVRTEFGDLPQVASFPQDSALAIVNPWLSPGLTVLSVNGILIEDGDLDAAFRRNAFEVTGALTANLLLFDPSTGDLSEADLVVPQVTVAKLPSGLTLRWYRRSGAWQTEVIDPGATATNLQKGDILLSENISGASGTSQEFFAAVIAALSQRSLKDAEFTLRRGASDLLVTATLLPE